MYIYTNIEAILFHLIPRSPNGDCTTTSAKLRHTELWFRRSEIPGGGKQCGFYPARFYTTGRECHCRRHFTCSYLAKCGAFTSTHFFTSKYCHVNSPAVPDTNATNYINNSQRNFWRWVPGERMYNKSQMDLVLLIKPDYSDKCTINSAFNCIIFILYTYLDVVKNVRIHTSNVTSVCSFIFLFHRRFSHGRSALCWGPVGTRALPEWKHVSFFEKLLVKIEFFL